MDIETKQAGAPEMERLHQRLFELERARLEDRIVLLEDFGGIKVQMTSFDSRIGHVEDGVRRLMTHSTWLLRILIGAIAVAMMQFLIEGNFHVAP